MPQKKGSARNPAISLRVVEPYDFGLSLRVVKSFQPAPSKQDDRLRLATKIAGMATLIEVSKSPAKNGKIRASSVPKSDDSRIREIAEWILFAELDLAPFYQVLSGHPRLKSVTRELYGLKPMRPISLFEMAVIAITEQQISLPAAYQIRSRIIQRFGEPVNNQWIFPEPEALAQASLEDLRSNGLSHQKAQYIHDLSAKIVDVTLDLDILKTMNDDQARETIMNLKGFGRWSADYILIRGLARPDCVPADDLGIRKVVGEYFGNGQQATSSEVVDKLEPFRPFRGLLAFYLLAKHRQDPAKV
jgi:DNA-3-methyladenine glycosylase II